MDQDAFDGVVEDVVDMLEGYAACLRNQGQPYAADEVDDVLDSFLDACEDSE